MTALWVGSDVDLPTLHRCRSAEKLEFRLSCAVNKKAHSEHSIKYLEDVFDRLAHDDNRKYKRSGTWPRTRSLNAPSPVQHFGPCGRIMKNSAMVMDSTRYCSTDPKKQYNIAATCKECWKKCSLYCNFKKHVRKFHSESNVTDSLFIDESKNEKEEEELMITRAVSCNRRQEDSEENVKKEIESINLTVMQATAGIVSMEQCEAVKKIINSIGPTIIATWNQSNNRNKLLPSKITSSNKNIAPQRRLFKTKKKKNTSKINRVIFCKAHFYRNGYGLALNLLHPDVVADSNIRNFEEV